MSANGAKKRLLVVDDEPELRQVIATTLRLSGYEVTTAESGSHALVALESRDVDLVVSDVRMPDGDGLELLEQLRLRGIRVPVVLMTGYADVTPGEARRRGAACLVSKPFRLEELLEIIDRFSRSGSASTSRT